MGEPPIVVDLGGTLLQSDLLVDSALRFARDQPHCPHLFSRSLAHGKPALKQKLELVIERKVAPLRSNDSVIELITRKRGMNRKVARSTAVDHRLGDKDASRLNLFNEVVVAASNRNLPAHTTRSALSGCFGELGLNYTDLHDVLPDTGSEVQPFAFGSRYSSNDAMALWRHRPFNLKARCQKRS